MKESNMAGPGLHFLITGGTGFIGTCLVRSLLREGHHVTILTRQAVNDTENCRHVDSLESISEDALFAAVINLAGESLADRRWTSHYKQKISDSRFRTTESLLALLQRLQEKPAAMLSASAIGYYGHQGDAPLSENAEVVPGFAQHLCQQWESLACDAEVLGIRVCRLRFGVVLDRGGGAMNQMRRPFDFGMANWLGTGRQWLSWVHRQDVIRAIQFLLRREDLSGPFNVTAPEPVTSRGFCNAMKQHKRTLITLPVPGFALRLLVGEMAEELLLNGQRVVPTALQKAGFEFQYPQLEVALKNIL
jgi:uncharacterized protein (TIGR01777 family)